jgi:hypothetical protein
MFHIELSSKFHVVSENFEHISHVLINKEFIERHKTVFLNFKAL